MKTSNIYKHLKDLLVLPICQTFSYNFKKREWEWLDICFTILQILCYSNWWGGADFLISKYSTFAYINSFIDFEMVVFLKLFVFKVQIKKIAYHVILLEIRYILSIPLQLPYIKKKKKIPLQLPIHQPRSPLPIALLTLTVLNCINTYQGIVSRSHMNQGHIFVAQISNITMKLNLLKQSTYIHNTLQL